MTTRVTEPKLRLTKTAPTEVMACDPIPMTFVVTHPGSGTSRNVRIEDRLPQGLTTTDGKTSFMVTIGDLGPGESKKTTVNVKAARTGSYQNKATATADGGLRAESSTTTTRCSTGSGPAGSEPS